MAYIGSTPTSQSFTSGTDYFSGNGSTTAYTLSRQVSSINDVMVVIENVVQKPLDAYTIVGTTLTFTSAPPSGTNNIYVRYMSTSTVAIQPNDLSVTTNKIADATITAAKLDSAVLQPVNISDKVNSSTGYLALPNGTTAQRPVSPSNGMIRYNTTLNQNEIYQNSAWNQFSFTYAIEYLVIAGGASGGSCGASSGLGGGGGAGGYRTNVTGQSSGGGAGAEAPMSLVAGTSYNVIVGAGGAARTGNSVGANGSDSTFASITSIGGGGGSLGDAAGNAASGGSGGGGGGGGGSAPRNAGAAGTSGQGYAGGNGSSAGQNYPAGGGGGAGSLGGNYTSNLKAGDGGAGVSSNITGSAVTRAGGGGGGINTVNGGASPGAGGSGGGGAGGINSYGSAGTVNTGSGGGGSGGDNATGSGAGGSGVVILRYAGTQRATGGTVTSSGGYTIHTFTSSGTFIA